ncbi:PglL family O-oligosaccharyltransferase [Acidovorax sp. 69]|uniref:PglL family O-oligosaccharyltransferase n=1 Tax=Acidovorax sp. 69 TaxID=2035202 RepID=UPI0018E27737|nr:O-antigen ligase family protein [Acidovorax sp. 69]
MKEKLLMWAGVVLFLSYLLPNHYSPWLSFHQELTAAVAFAPLLAWACTRVAPFPKMAMGVTALAVVPLLQIAGGQIYFATDGWMSSLYLLGFALAIYAGALYYRTDGTHFAPGSPGNIHVERSLGSIENLWVAILMAALCSAGLAFHQWLIPSYQGIYIVEIPPQSRPFANLAQPNQLATLLMLGIAGLMFVWETRRLRAPFAMAAAFLLLWALVMTGSRTVLMALLWLLPAYALMRCRCKLRTTPAAIAAGVVFYFVMTWLWPLLSEWLLLNSGNNTALERMGSIGIRKVFWISMLDAIGRAPWLGYGWGQVSIAQVTVALDHPPTYSLFESAHNLFIDLALWNGLPIALLIFLGIGAWFLGQVRNCNNAMKWATLVGVALVFNHAMVEYPLNYAYFLLPVGFFIGALSTSNNMPMQTYAVFPTAKRLGLLTMGGLMSAATVLVVVEYFPIEEDWNLMRFQEARIGNLEVKDTQSSALVLTGLQQFLRFSRTEARPGMSVDELDAMRRASERFAYAAPMFKYALAQALNQQPENALITLRTMCSMQVESVCLSAKRQWDELGKTDYPELENLPFPSFGTSR